MRKSKTLLIIFLLLSISITFYGCVIRQIPYDSFDSMQELKDSIGSSLNILYPDTKRYVFENNAMYRKDYTGKTNVVMGCYFGGNLNSAESDTDLWDLYFTCRILEIAYDDRNHAPTLNANTKVLETDVNEQIHEESDDPDIRALGWYPEGSKIVKYSYQFDFKGCRYTLTGNLVIPPEKLNALDGKEVETIVENSKNEMLDLVKSIIEQEKT